MVLIFFFVFYDVQMFYYISFSHSNQWEGIGVWGIIFVKQREIYVLFVNKKKMRCMHNIFIISGSACVWFLKHKGLIYHRCRWEHALHNNCGIKTCLAPLQRKKHNTVWRRWTQKVERWWTWLPFGCGEKKKQDLAQFYLFSNWVTKKLDTILVFPKNEIKLL